MVLEAFHKTLKYVYLKEEKNQRLDILLWNLLKTMRDKNFERLVKLCNGGKVTHYVNANMPLTVVIVLQFKYIILKLIKRQILLGLWYPKH